MARRFNHEEFDMQGAGERAANINQGKGWEGRVWHKQDSAGDWGRGEGGGGWCSGARPLFPQPRFAYHAVGCIPGYHLAGYIHLHQGGQLPVYRRAHVCRCACTNTECMSNYVSSQVPQAWTASYRQIEGNPLSACSRLGAGVRSTCIAYVPTEEVWPVVYVGNCTYVRTYAGTCTCTCTCTCMYGRTEGEDPSSWD